MPAVSSIVDDPKKLLYVAGIEAVKEYQNDSVVRVNAPKIKLVVSPFIPPLVPIEIFGADLGDLVLSVNTMKGRSMAAGTFSVRLAPDDEKMAKFGVGWPLQQLWKKVGVSMRDLFKQNTYAQLHLNGYLVMTGLLKRFRKETDISANSKVYVAEFEELGGIFNMNIMQRTLFFFGLDSNVPKASQKLLDAQLKATLSSLPDALQYYMQGFIASTYLQGGEPGFTPYFRMSDGIPFGMRMLAKSAPLGAIANSMWLKTAPANLTLFENGSGSSFWDFMKQLVPEPFCELWTETGGRTIVTGRLGPDIASIGSAKVEQGVASGVMDTPRQSINLCPMLPGASYVVARSTPYENPVIGSSPYAPFTYPYTLGVFDLLLGGDFVIVTDKDVISKSLGWDGEGQYTLFDVTYQGVSETNTTNNPVKANGPPLPLFPGGIKTFGHKLYSASINPTGLEWAPIVAQMNKDEFYRLPLGMGQNIAGNQPVLAAALGNYMRNQSKFMEGSITTRAMPYARPGMVLLYLKNKDGTCDDPRELGLYYIDNVSNENGVGTIDTTTFSVIRGTPIPWDYSTLALLLLDWEIINTL